MQDLGIYFYELSEQQRHIALHNEEAYPQYSLRCKKRSEDMRALAHFFGCSDRNYDKYLNYKFLVLGE